MITTKEQMAQALEEAINGQSTFPGMLKAIEPWQMHCSVLNELLRNVPSGAAMLILSVFAGTIAFDQELQAPEVEGLDWLELSKRHAVIAYDGLRRKTETDPTMQEYALSRVKRPLEPPRVMTEAERRRSAFSLLHFTPPSTTEETDDASEENGPDAS